MPEEPSRRFSETAMQHRRGRQARRTRRRRELYREFRFLVSSRAARTVLAAAFLIVALLLIGSYTFLPPLLGFLFGQQLEGQLGLQSRPQVELRSDPPPAMLLGKFAAGSITFRESEFGNVRPEVVTIELDSFDLEVLRSVGSGALRSQEPLSGGLRAELSEEEVSRIARSSVEDIPLSGVDLEEGSVQIETGTEILSVEVPVSIEGDLDVREQTIIFEPRRLAAFGVTVPERISRQLLSETDFRYPIEDLPLGVEITGVEIGRDRLILSGDVENLPFGGASEASRDAPDG